MTETEAIRHMWRNVLLVAIEDHRRAISAARRGKQGQRIDSVDRVVKSVQWETARAAEWLHSADCRAIADLAGIGIKPSRAMSYITGEVVAVRRFATGAVG